MNSELRLELLRVFGSQIRASRALGIDASKISRFVQGHDEPNDRELALLEEALGRKVVRRIFKGHRVQSSRSALTAEQPLAS